MARQNSQDSVTRLLNVSSPTVTSSSVAPSAQVFATRSAIISPAVPSSTSGASIATVHRQQSTPTARIQLMSTPGSGGASVTRVASASNIAAQSSAVRLQVATGPATMRQVSASNGSGEMVSVVVTGAGNGGAGTTFNTVRGTPVEALLRRSPVNTTIRPVRHIAQILPPSSGFVTIQQQAQQQQQNQQIVSISSSGQGGQGGQSGPATIVLSAAGPVGQGGYNQFRASPQPRQTIRYSDGSGISSVRLAGGASANVVTASPLRQQITAIRPAGGGSNILTVSTTSTGANQASSIASSSSSTSATTTATSTTVANQQQASPPVHLVSTTQLPPTSTSVSNRFCTISLVYCFFYFVRLLELQHHLFRGDLCQL